MSSTDLNRIRRYPITAVFGLYIVSGVLKDGTLRVSWNSGIDAAEQMDYGVGDDSVPNTTDWTRLEKGEKGYIEGKNKRKFRKNHIINFPQTFVDTYHYFRVRSENQKGDTLESEVFQVYVTEKTIQRSYMASVQVRVEPVTVSNQSQESKGKLESSVEGSTEPEISTDDNGSVGASKDEKDVSPADQNQPVKSNFETNISTTVT